MQVSGWMMDDRPTQQCPMFNVRNNSHHFSPKQCTQPCIAQEFYSVVANGSHPRNRAWGPPKTGARGRLPGPRGPLRGGADGGLVYPLTPVPLPAKARAKTLKATKYLSQKTREQNQIHCDKNISKFKMAKSLGAQAVEGLGGF